RFEAVATRRIGHLRYFSGAYELVEKRALFEVVSIAVLGQLRVWNRERDERCAETLQNVHQLLSFGTNWAIHASHADLQFADVHACGTPVEGKIRNAHVPPVGLRNNGHDHRAIFRITAHGAKPIVGPPQCHHTVAADSSERRTQSGDAAGARW